MVRVLLIGLLLLCSVLHARSLVIASSQERSGKQDYNSGEFLYRTYCATCHGQTGRGDGPAAATFQKPLPDLTMLAIRAGGQFPRAEVTRIVTGEKESAAHRPGEMPAWGRVLRSLEADDRVARQRIEAIVSYLESMQRQTAR